MGESSQRLAPSSNLQGRKFAPKKIALPVERISFRDIAKLAARRKTEAFLVERTGCDGSTAKRWLSGASRVPATAFNAVMVDILSRVEL